MKRYASFSKKKIIKSIIGVVLAVSILFVFFNRLRYSSSYQETAPSQTVSNKLVIAFDFHGVLAQENYTQVAHKLTQMIWRSSDTLKLLGALFNPRMWYAARQFKKEHDVLEIVLQMLAQTYPVIGSHIPDILVAINQHTPIEGSIAVLKAIKAAGYPVYLASNIGPTSLCVMQQRYPEIFELFDGIYIATEQNGHKPDKQYFDGLRAFVDQQFSGAPILLIDDRIDNLEGARNSGQNIEGLHFTSAEQLEQDLKNLALEGDDTPKVASLQS